MSKNLMFFIKKKEFLCKNGPLFRWLFFQNENWPMGSRDRLKCFIEPFEYLRSVPKFLVSAYLPSFISFIVNTNSFDNK